MYRYAVTLFLFLVTSLGCQGVGGTHVELCGAGGGGGDSSTTTTTSATAATSSGGGDPNEAPTLCASQADCVGHYPFSVCIDGQCAMRPWSKNCIGATGNGQPDTGCDDQNPCTTDVIVDGQCQHQIAGTGTACGENMQCWSASVECCPIEVTCGAEGVQDQCADGSICFSGQCWMSCTTDEDCQTAVGTTCGVKTVGSVTIKTCL